MTADDDAGARSLAFLVGDVLTGCRHGFRRPTLKELHLFLQEKTAVGSVSRQEAVSMIPTFLLDVKPHHVVRAALQCRHHRCCTRVVSMHVDVVAPRVFVWCWWH